MKGRLGEGRGEEGSNAPLFGLIHHVYQFANYVFIAVEDFSVFNTGNIPTFQSIIYPDLGFSGFGF